MGTSTGTFAWWQQDDVPGTDVCLYHRGKRGSQSDNVLWRLRYALLPRRQGVTRPLRCLGYALSLSHRSPWMAPEVLHDEPSDEKSGFYCYGVLMFPLVTRRYPGIISIKCRLLELWVSWIKGQTSQTTQIPNGHPWSRVVWIVTQGNALHFESCWTGLGMYKSGTACRLRCSRVCGCSAEMWCCEDEPWRLLAPTPNGNGCCCCWRSNQANRMVHGR